MCASDPTVANTADHAASSDLWGAAHERQLASEGSAAQATKGALEGSKAALSVARGAAGRTHEVYAPRLSECPSARAPPVLPPSPVYT